MRRLTALLLPLCLLLLLGSCSGASIPPNYFGGNDDGLPDLEWDLVTDPGSSPTADEVNGQMMTLDDAQNAKAPSSLPSGYQGIQGMYFTPVTPSGAGFSGQLSVRITMGNPIPDEYNGVRLFLFHVDPDTREASIMDSARGRAGNWVTFRIDALGFFVVAENLSIPRPGTAFSVSAFADLAQTTAGTLINFWAVPNNGTAPYTYAWTFGDGGTGTGAQTTHTYNSPGTYNVNVIATDATGNTAPAASTPIEITASPNPLTGLAVSVTQDSADHLSFTYGATITGGTGPFTYSWDFDGDGTEDASGAPPVNYTFSTEGLYGGTLTVEDSLGDSISADFVSDARLLVLETQDTLGYEPYDVTFSLVALGFAPGDPLEVVFDDGTSDTAPGDTVLHTYLAEGTYNAYATGQSTLDGTDYPLQSAMVSIVVNKRPRPVAQLTQPVPVNGSGTFKILGYNFGATQGTSTVKFETYDLPVLDWSDTVVEVEVPPTHPMAGDVVLNTDFGATPPIHVTVDFSESIAIQNVIPRQVTPGGEMVIVGLGLFTSDSLTLGGQDCTVLDKNIYGIVATAPTDIALGPAQLVVTSGNDSAPFDCEVVDGSPVLPVVDTVTPQPYQMFTGGVTLSGSNFGDGIGGIVFDGTQVMRIGSWDDMSVLLNDSQFPVDGWAVLINRQVPSAPFDLKMVWAPQITAVDPEFAAIGETVTISGTGFYTKDPTDHVTLGGNELQVLNWSLNTITVQITDGSDDGDIVVHTEFDSNPWPFTVVPRAPGPPGGGQT